jgi:gluconokinase
MSDIIYPRSPRETMCGWVHLPRFIDKIRLHLAGRLHADYQANFTKGFDQRWLAAAGVEPSAFIEVVRDTITDGEVADWVGHHVKKSEAEKQAFARAVLDYPSAGDEAGQVRLRQRKEQAGLAHREDIQTFVDFIDADEKRL